MRLINYIKAVQIASNVIPKDKFGNPIYPSKWIKLKANEKILLSKGYAESVSKPNLFFRKIPEGSFYADMRGTEIVPIWSDTAPLFYWKFHSKIPNWKRRRLIKDELVELYALDCPCRLSFYFHDSEEFERTSTYTDTENCVFDWDDGHCRFCGKDFQNEGSFCSKDCEEKYREKLKTPCAICGEKIDFRKEVMHHIHYFPEETIFVHADCHNKIHKTNLFPHLKPSKEEIERYYNKKGNGQ